MKYILFIVLALSFNRVMAQNERYRVQFEDSLTILFPSKPVIEGVKDISESYIAETANGTFTVLERSHGSNFLPDSLSMDTLTDAYMHDLSNDPNLGDISDTERIKLGKLEGTYHKMVWYTGDEPALVVMTLILINKESGKIYTIGYQCFDTGEKVLYDKESFIATVQP